MDTLEARAQDIHERVGAAVRTQRASMHTLAQLLLELDRDELYRSLGYTTLRDYAWSEHELGARQVRELLNIARRLDQLPALDAAMASGEVPWTKARTMLSVLDADNEADWVERAKGIPVRELERQVYGLYAGSPPPTPEETHDVRGDSRRRFIVELYSQEEQIVRDALAVLRAQADDADVTDGDLLAQMARAVLQMAESGEAAPTSEPYRIVLEHCPECLRTVGVEDEVSDTLVAEACCNAEVVDLTPGAGERRGRLGRAIPLRTQRAVFHEAGYGCAVPGCRGRLWLHLHHLALWSGGGDHSEENLVCLCASHHRAVHEGVLALERLENGDLRFERANGRVSIAPAATHVGHRAPKRQPMVGPAATPASVRHPGPAPCGPPRGQPPASSA